MLQKNSVVNVLFLSSFPAFGIGKYIAQTGNFSVGQFISVLPILVLMLFYVADTLLKSRVRHLISFRYTPLFLFTLFAVISLIVGLQKGFPGLNPSNTIALCISTIAIMHGAIIVQFYNAHRPDFTIANILYWGLTADILINLCGYAAGLRNPIHSIDGRLNLPFGQGFYSTANTVAVVNLLIVGFLYQKRLSFWPKAFVLTQFVLNLVLMVGFNSRLSIMLFFLTLALLATGVIYRYRTVYFVSLFTLPLLLNFSVWIYDFLQLPLMNQLFQRVSYKDVTGFNGRRDLWERGLDWMTNGGEGIILGNGYHGYYFMNLINDLESKWFRSSVNLHMHSSMLEYALTTGVVGVALVLIFMYGGLKHLAAEARRGGPNTVLISSVVYLLFLFQIDNYLYITNFGSLILITALSPFVLKPKHTPEIAYENINRYSVVQPGSIR